MLEAAVSSAEKSDGRVLVVVHTERFGGEVRRRLATMTTEATRSRIDVVHVDRVPDHVRGRRFVTAHFDAVPMPGAWRARLALVGRIGGAS